MTKATITECIWLYDFKRIESMIVEKKQQAADMVTGAKADDSHL